MIIGTKELYEEAKTSLESIQNFDSSSLSREDVLGSELNFKEVVPSAQSLIDLYKRLSVTALEDFPDQVLTIIKNISNSVLQIFEQILQFSSASGNPGDKRTQLISSLNAQFPEVFKSIHPYISYSLHRSADFQRLDSDARATLKSIEDKSALIAKQMATHESDAKNVLAEIRSVAAEEGVTKQAAHFRVESELHKAEADIWQKHTARYALLLGCFAILSLFIHKFAFLKPENTYDAIQLSISKILIFSVIAYMLFLSARNFLSHKHNEIVNKHRQNALMTHRALVEGSGDLGVREVVLVQAASCIFSPQSTGYAGSQSEGDSASQKSVIEILSKTASNAVKGST